MNAHALVEALVQRGLDPAEQAAKQSLFTDVLEAWRITHGGEPLHVWFVPGRLEVFGKHTDYAGGRALVAAAPRGFAVAAAPRGDHTIRVIDARRGETLVLPLPPTAERLPGWRNYVGTAARRLIKNFPRQSFAADIVLASDLPPAAGMSSSSALVIAVAEALARIAQAPATAEWQEHIRDPLDAAGYYACIENGRSFGGLAGDAGVGTLGGSEDHSAILNGRPGHVLGFAFVPPRALGAARVPVHWRFVIGNCGIKANKTGRVQAAYNQLSTDAARLLDLANSRRPAGTQAASLAAAIASPDDLSALRDIAGTLRDRLEHFVREDARVPLAMQAFDRGDETSIGRLAAQSQEDAERLLRNQIPETVNLVITARAAGAFAASSFGAGFGGAAWALVEAERADAFARQWRADAFPICPGVPLTELSTK